MNDVLYRWRFGPVEFDEARRELRVAGLDVELENRPLEVLSLLLRHAGEVVTKEELFDQVWAGRPTVDHVLATAVGKLRKALDATGESRIVTLPRIGYRLDGPVERIAVGRQAGSTLKLEAGQPVPGRDHFLLERALGHTGNSEVWLARQPRSRDVRVFKFALDGERLSAIKREATLLRVLRESLGERADFARIVDWNFEQPPYFLECEYGGQSLPEWAAQHLPALDTAQRVGLFIPIIEAVAAAHGVGVLHKDLKPANVLVAPRGDGWQIRLTDFGSSHLLQPERLAELGITRLGLTVSNVASDSTSGTPLYLAPELLGGQPPTVRSDVYALGVMLYQWLVGDLRRPLSPGWERDIDDALLRDDIAAATDYDPAQRTANAEILAERLRTLPQRRERQARHASEVATQTALRAALERSRTRRPWVIASIGVLCAGLIGTGLLWRHSAQQRDIARKQAARAEAVVRFLSEDLLGSVAPGGAGFEHAPTIKDMLEAASGKLKNSHVDAAVRGSIHAALGQSWRTLGDGERGVAELRAAVRDYTRAFGERDESTLRTRYALARSLAYVSKDTDYGEAEKLLQATDALAGERLRGDNALAYDAAFARGVFHTQRMQAGPALQAWQRADALQRKLFPDDAQRAFLIRENLADTALRQGHDKEAAAQLQAMLTDPLLDAARIGESGVAEVRMQLARALRNLGRYAEALPLAQSAAASSERLFGADNYQTLIQLSTIASIHGDAGDCPAALAVQRTVRQRMAARYGEDKQATLVETGNLGDYEYDCGDRNAGLALLRRAESQLRARFGKDNAAANAFHGIIAEKLAPAAPAPAQP